MKEVEIFEHNGFVTTHGYIPLDKVQEVIQLNEKVILENLPNPQPDHIIYAAKEYDKDNNFKLHIYCMGGVELNDEEFVKRTSKLSDYLIYAIHKN